MGFEEETIPDMISDDGSMKIIGGRMDEEQRDKEERYSVQSWASSYVKQPSLGPEEHLDIAEMENELKKLNNEVESMEPSEEKIEKEESSAENESSNGDSGEKPSTIVSEERKESTIGSEERRAPTSVSSEMNKNHQYNLRKRKKK